MNHYIFQYDAIKTQYFIIQTFHHSPPPADEQSELSFEVRYRNREILLA
jgi:hypothetical protein